MHTLMLESLVRSGLNFSASVNFSRGKLNASIQEGPKKELLVDRRVAVLFYSIVFIALYKPNVCVRDVALSWYELAITLGFSCVA